MIAGLYVLFFFMEVIGVEARCVTGFFGARTDFNYISFTVSICSIILAQNSYRT